MLDSSAAGIGWDLGELEGPEPGEAPLGEKLELRVFQAAPEEDVAHWLDETLHSVVVALVDQKFLANKEQVDWLEACAEHVQGSNGSHYLLPVPIHEGVQEDFLAASKAFQVGQVKPWTSFDLEEAGRLDQLALRILDRLVRILAAPVFGRHDWKLKIFLSHAKRDGFHLAQSFKYFLGQQKWLGHFYDADDIQPGEDWQEALRQGVAHSVLLVLRTDIYDSRFWCRQEVRWAELYGIPVVVIDGRSGLTYPATDLGLDLAPTVRIPDGNLVRALYAVQQTALRSLLFRRRILAFQEAGALPEGSELVQLIAVPPSIAAVSHACDQFSAPEEGEDEARWLVYPDPPIRTGVTSAAQALASQVGAQLTTPQKLFARGEG